MPDPTPGRPARQWGGLLSARAWSHTLLGVRDDQQWCRVVMDKATDAFVRSLDVPSLDAVEVSGAKWAGHGFRSYRSADYPGFDVCAGPLAVGAFDLVIMEQVLEHVLWPYRAVRHVHQMLRPGGVFVVTTPFLIKIHNYPVDCSRWTELGLKHLLAEGGFPLDAVTTGSWGSRACVRANFREWVRYARRWHSLHNEPDFPMVVWAFARKGDGP